MKLARTIYMVAGCMIIFACVWPLLVDSSIARSRR